MKERCATIHEKNMKAFDIIEHLIACYNNDEDKCSTMEACNSCEHSATLEEITEALEVAISVLKKQEVDKCCETGTYKHLDADASPCCDCIRAKDHYMPYTEKES